MAVSTGANLDGVAAGLVLAASTRVISERTTVSLSEHGCRLGLLPSGLSLLGNLVPPDKRPLAMAVALGAIKRLNVHDAAALNVASFAQAGNIPALLGEVRSCPSDFFDVPFSRHCEQAPAKYANLLSEDVIGETINTCFGPTCDSMVDVLVRLADERAVVSKLLHSCSWRTREIADAVEPVLTEAVSALDKRRASPGALAATFMTLRMCFEGGGEQGVQRAHELEQHVNIRLAARDDFDEGLRVCAQSGQMARGGSLPSWQPAALDSRALDVASDIYKHLRW